MNHIKNKVLFILKKRKVYDSVNTEKTMSSGLFNSASFVNKMLKENGVESNLVEVIDNNCIDREVTKYKPTHVVIEALWVIPDKFDVLNKLHPKVKWIIRLHSEMPFIANEGIAMDWIFKYHKIGKYKNVYIAANTPKMYSDLKSVGIHNIMFLPNYYFVQNDNPPKNFEDKDHVDIGCFGAVRPMKNQLIQAVAAIEFGNRINKPVHFHMNFGRVEKGENVIKNIRAIFENQTEHKLIEHGWYDHDDFIRLIEKMDLGLQVSFNETFNIVAADFVFSNVPIIGSDEIVWLNWLFKANPTSTDNIVKKMEFIYLTRKFNIQVLNKINLKNTANKAKKIWLNVFKKH